MNTENLNATSDCPFGKCDGSGLIVSERDGIFYGSPCQCYEKRIMDNKLSFANIPEEFSDLKIKDFDTEIYGNEDYRKIARRAKKVAINFVKDFETYKEMGKGLYLYSGVRGSGKTRMAVSIGNALISQCRETVKFVTTVNLLNEIKACFDRENGESQSELLKKIKSVNVLILDDIGTEKQTAWVDEVFGNILDDRMTSKKITIFTSNCEAHMLLHNTRSVSRIDRMSIPIAFPEDSVRRALAQKENEELIKQLLR